jgi:hypothetical protein
MDSGTLALLKERLLVRVILSHGRPYARISLYEQDAAALDKVAQLVSHPNTKVRRHQGRLSLLVQAQGAVITLCDALLPYLQEGDPLHAELVLARAVAEAPWYERYEILEKFLEEE